jgi:hypothetical protein
MCRAPPPPLVPGATPNLPLLRDFRKKIQEK